MQSRSPQYWLNSRMPVDPAQRFRRLDRSIWSRLRKRRAGGRRLRPERFRRRKIHRLRLRSAPRRYPPVLERGRRPALWLARRARRRLARQRASTGLRNERRDVQGGPVARRAVRRKGPEAARSRHPGRGNQFPYEAERRVLDRRRRRGGHGDEPLSRGAACRPLRHPVRADADRRRQDPSKNPAKRHVGEDPQRRRDVATRARSCSPSPSSRSLSTPSPACSATDSAAATPFSSTAPSPRSMRPNSSATTNSGRIGPIVGVVRPEALGASQ